jgi:hypothetical protein
LVTLEAGFTLEQTQQRGRQARSSDPSLRAIEGPRMNRLPPTRSAKPAGIAFAIRELVLLRAWAEWRGLRMDIALDHTGADGEYEELVCLYRPGALVPALALWRTASAVVVEGVRARPERFGSLSTALEALSSPVGRRT